MSRRTLRIIAVATLLLGAIGLAWRLSAPTLERRLVRWAEARTGWSIGVQELDLRPFAGRATVAGLVLGSPEQPFLTADRVEVRFDPMELLGGRVHLLGATVVRPRLDLTAPSPPTTDDGPLEAPALRLDGLWVEDGRIAGTIDRLEAPPVRWALGGLALEGRYDPSHLELRLTGAALEIRPDEGPEVPPLTVRAGLEGPPLGPWTIHDLVISGSGLGAEGRGRIGIGDGDPLEASFDLEVTGPAWGLDDGTVEAVGRLDLRAEEGEVDLHATRLPGALLDRWLPVDTTSDRITLEASLSWTSHTVNGARGRANATWARGAEILATGVAELDHGGMALDLALLPARSGRRHLEAVVEGDLAGAPEAITLASGRLSLTTGSVAEELATIAAHWPELELPTLPRTARLDLNADLSGSLADPVATGVADLRPPEGGRIAVEFTARPLKSTVEATLDVSTFPVVLEEVVGRLGGRASLRLAGTSWRAEGDLVLSEVESELPFDRLELDATTDGQQATIRGLTATGPDGARLRVGGQLDVELPIDWASLDLEGSLPGQGLEEIRGTVRLDNGILETRLAAPRTDHAARIGARIACPSGSVPAPPGVLEGPTGPLEVELEVDALAFTSGTTTLIADTLRLTLRAPLEALGTATGAASIHGLRLRSGEVEVEASPVRLALGAGSLILESTHLVAPGLAGRVVGRVEVDPTWPAPATPPLDPAGGDRSRQQLPFRDLDLTATVEAELGFLDPQLDGHLAGTLHLGGSLERLELRAEIEPGTARYSPTAAAGEPSSPLFFHHRGGELEAELRPEALADSRGTLVLALDEVLVEDRFVRPLRAVELVLADRRLDLLPTSLDVDGGRLDLAASAILAPDPLAVEHLELRLLGDLDADIARMIVPGRRIGGRLRFDVDIAGPPDQLAGRFELRAPEFALLLDEPYPIRVEGLDAEGHLAGGVVELSTARLRLNEGDVILGGRRSAAGDLELTARGNHLRFRLDYGLRADLGLDLRLALPAEGRGRLSGQIVIDRGLLTDEIDLERELMAILAPPPTLDSPDAEDPLAAIDLDLDVVTRDGVRVKNNVADLKASWSALEVRGTAAEPLVGGEIDLAPGGLVQVWGQLVRIDRGTVRFSPTPGVAPSLDVVTTSSFDDPSLRREEHLFASAAGESAPGLQEAVASGLATSLGGRLTAGLESALAPTRIRIEPVVVFTDTSPQARLNVSRDLSAYATLTLSLDLREAQSKTYFLDLQRLPHLPGVWTRIATDDLGHESVTLEQRLELGRPEALDRGRHGPSRHLDRLTVEAPTPKLRRFVRRESGLERGAPLPAGIAFDLEVDLVDALRWTGYPDPSVDVTVGPGDPTAEVTIRIDPGIRAAIRFDGDEPRRSTRRRIARAYRVGDEADGALRTMKALAESSFRARGHLEPEVTIEVETVSPEEQLVLVRSVAGPRTEIAGIRFNGVDPATGDLLATLFDYPLARAELAVALPEADRRLLAVIRSQGVVEPSLGSRSVEEGLLVLDVTTAGQRLVHRVWVEGMPDDGPTPALDIEPGEPFRANRIARAVASIEDDLRRRGYADATVAAVVEPTDGDRVDVRIDVDAGQRVAIDTISFASLGSTRPSWAESVARLSTGDPLWAVGEARRQLLATGLYSSIDTEIVRREDTADVRFTLDEQARFLLAYGLRWQTESGLAAVLEAADRNLLGRGLLLGLHARWARDEWNGRAFFELPRPFGRPTAVELYAEKGERTEDGLVTESLEAAFQLRRPWGASANVRFYGRYRERHIFEEDPNPFFPLDVTIQSPYLGLQLLVDNRLDPVLGSEGLFASIDLSGSDEVLGSDFSYLRLFGQLNFYRPVGPFIWAQSWRLGAADAFDQELIRDLRFFAGGEFSVRGYPDRSLGPEERLGALVRPTGGNALVVLNQELRFPIWGDLSGLVFFDAGNVWRTLDDVEADLATSAGLGFRARTPFGLLRLDVGWPLDRRPGDREYELSFGLGDSF